MRVEKEQVQDERLRRQRTICRNQKGHQIIHHNQKAIFAAKTECLLHQWPLCWQEEQEEECWLEEKKESICEKGEEEGKDTKIRF